MKLKRHGISKMSDDQLVWMYVETKEKRYAGELFLRYLPLVYGICLYEYPDVRQAGDAVQAAFAHTCEALADSGGINGDFRQWLCRQVDAFISRQLDRETGAADEVTGNVLSLRGRGFAALLGDGDPAALKELGNPAHKLPLPQRQALELFFTEGRSFADISEETGILVGNVRGHIIKGVEALCAEGAEQPKPEKQ